jgi:hypothetical protein
MYIEYWWGSQKERDHWEDLDIGGWTMLEWILERQEGMIWVGLIWFKIGNEPAGSIKCWEFLEWLHNRHLLKKGSAP